MTTKEQNIEYYKQNRNSFISLYPGKHIIIKEMQVAGIYNSNTEAIDEARRIHEPGSYIIERPMETPLRKN